MTQFELFCLTFYALDSVWETSHNEELRQYLSDANPFLWDGENSAVPEIYTEFCAVVQQENISLEESYHAAAEYINALPVYVREAFSSITPEKWAEGARRYLSQPHKMNTVKIMNEYLHGSVWVYNSEGIALYKYPLVDDDPVISALNSQAMEMFAGYYEFDSHDVPCWFNHDKEKRELDQMLDLIQRIIARLDEINDGSFVVEDCETERLKGL